MSGHLAPTVIALVASLGITIMPEWKEGSAIVYVPIADLPLHRTIDLTWRSIVPLSDISPKRLKPGRLANSRGLVTDRLLWVWSNNEDR